MIKQLFILLLAGVLITSCKSRPKEDLRFPGTEMEPGELRISSQAMEEIVQNISSPIEMAAIIKDLGVPFSSQHLSKISTEDRYSTSFNMALSLGILGADLGYLNVYEKTGTSVNYLSAINKLADGLRVSQFFDFNTLKRLATGSTNIDSLMFLSVHSFNQMDEHLRNTDRNNLSALMIAGAWIEGMYFATQVVNQTKDDFLAEYIAEQKITLNNLMVILKNFANDPEFAKLIKELELIKSEFDKVRITYEMGDPQAVEKDGMLMIVQQENSIVEISDGVLNNIIEATAKVRNRLLTM